MISVIKYSPETNLLIYFKFISSLKLNSDFLKSKTRKKNEHWDKHGLSKIQFFNIRWYENV